MLLLFCCVVANAQIKYESNTGYTRLFDVTYDATVQNKIYALTLSNHIVVSTNQGADWQLLHTHTSKLNSLKLVNNNTALAFSAKEGVYVLSLTDNSITKFFPIPDPNVEGATDFWISDYDIYGTDNSTIVVNLGIKLDLVNVTKVFYSNNAAVLWKEIYYSDDNNFVPVNKVAIAPGNPEKIFVTRGLGPDLDVYGGLFISNDAGATWTEKLPGIVLGPTAINPENTQEIMVATGVSLEIHPEYVYKSSDNGESWIAQNITWTNVINDNVLKIVYNPKNTDNIIILEENEIVSTTDGGTTWSNKVYDQYAVDYTNGLNASFDPSDDNRVIISTNYYPQVTTDFGATLTQLKSPFNDSYTVAADQTGDADHIYYGIQRGYVHRDLTTNEEDIHNVISLLEYTDAYSFITTDPIVAGRIFIYSYNYFGSSVSVSTDYGATSTLLFNPFGDEIKQIAVDPANNNIVYLSIRLGEGSSLYKIDLSNPEEINPEEIITPGDGIVTGILIDQTGKITIAKGAGLYTSTDAGQNWAVATTTGLTLGSADSIWDLTRSKVNTNNLILSSNVGIFTSTDGGTSWTQKLTQEVQKVSYSPYNAAIIAGASYNIPGLVFSADNGVNWKTITAEELNNISIAGVDFIFGDTSVTAYIATSDLGVMSYVVNYDALGITTPELQKNNIAIYPNPASSVLNITASDNSEIKNTVIYTLEGQKVIETAATSINVSALSNGIYIVKSTTSNGGSYTQKLIKQ